MEPCGQGVTPEQKICWVRMEGGVASKAEMQTVLVNEHLTQGHSLNEQCSRESSNQSVPSGISLGFPGASDGKESAAMQESWIQTLSQEDPLEKGMAPHSSVLAWRIPWTEEPDGLQPMESQRVGRN